MIIIGHSAIPHNRFVNVASIADIKHTKQGEIVYFSADFDDSYLLALHCQEHSIDYAVMIKNMTQALIFASFNPTFLILCGDYALASEIEGVIEHYLLDCKLLYPIENENEIAPLAKLGIDGVIFKRVLDRI